MTDQTSDTALRNGLEELGARSNVLERLTVEYVDTDSIKANSYNPNQQSAHDFQLLLLSMREDGFTQPILCQKDSREIVDGEHRWRAGRELGMTQVPVVFVEMTHEQMRIATLRHNRARGSEEPDLVAKLLHELADLDVLQWTQDSLLLDDAELARLLAGVPVPADPPPQVTACGPLEPSSIIDPALEQGEQCQLKFSTVSIDPPWPEWGGVQKGANRHYDLLSVKQIPGVILDSGVFNMAENAHMYMWTTGNHLMQANSVIEALGFRYITCIPWVKTNKKAGIGQYFRGKAEYLLFAVKGKGFEVCTDDRYVEGLIKADARAHSQKPDEVYDLIERRSKGPFLEIFARRGAARHGWQHWGNEIGKLDDDSDT